VRRLFQVYSSGNPTDMRGWVSTKDAAWVVGFVSLCVKRMAHYRPADGVVIIIRTPE
jgi:hypothetical protein